MRFLVLFKVLGQPGILCRTINVAFGGLAELVNFLFDSTATFMMVAGWSRDGHGMVTETDRFGIKDDGCPNRIRTQYKKERKIALLP